MYYKILLFSLSFLCPNGFHQKLGLLTSNALWYYPSYPLTLNGILTPEGEKRFGAKHPLWRKTQIPLIFIDS